MTPKRIFVRTKSASDWQGLLAKPKLHWKRGKSAMSAAVSWEGARSALPSEITQALEASGDPALTGLELVFAIPEWETPLPGGETASHTDIMAVARNDQGVVVIGVEAKVDEPFGPTLAEKRSNASDGQTERLEYLHFVLGAEGPLPDSLRYQLLHRTASAILTARALHSPTAVMAVQSFSPGTQWQDDYVAFSEALGAAPGIEKASPVPGHTAPHLFLAWCTGDQECRKVEIPSVF